MSTKVMATMRGVHTVDVDNGQPNAQRWANCPWCKSKNVVWTDGVRVSTCRHFTRSDTITITFVGGE